MTAEIRPGIYRPDWSVVTRLAAREALQERDASRLGLAGKWDQTLDPVQDRVWRTVLELFARSARSPRLHEIGEETGLTAESNAFLPISSRMISWASTPISPLSAVHQTF